MFGSKYALGFVALLAGCGSGDKLEEAMSAFGNALGGAANDISFKSSLVTGQIMGQEAKICVGGFPEIRLSDAAFDSRKNETLDYILATLPRVQRFDTGSSLQAALEADCSGFAGLLSFVTWEELSEAPDLTQLSDWGTFAPFRDPQGRPYVSVCARDVECEDGDILRITLNGVPQFEVELLNSAQCQGIWIEQGRSFLGVYAVNGTGYKGNCSFANRNTGEVTVSGASGGTSQSYQVLGGRGSYGEIQITN